MAINRPQVVEIIDNNSFKSSKSSNIIGGIYILKESSNTLEDNQLDI